MIPYVETHIVDHCNLKCKGCSHFSCLAEPNYFQTLENFEKEVKRLGELGLGIFRIMGGEPLLHPQVIDFCVLARKYLPNTHIVLVSNAILLPTLTDEQIQILNDNNIELCVSDYGLKINMEQFKKFKTSYFHEKGSMYNIRLDLNKKQSRIISFFNCDLVRGKWYFLRNGRLYQCCIMANIDIFNKHFNKNVNINPDDISIDIYTHTHDEILNFLSHPHDACCYCNTLLRHHSYSDFGITKGEITEWI